MKLMMSGRQAQLGKFEADSSAGRGLHEQVHHRFTTQRWNFFDRSFPYRLESARRVQNRDDLIRVERFDIEQMFSIPGHGG